ncbi:hypothetical protein IG631_20742 [Alternaria alternata]|nr:hypothetical protein IG631_20742 [Alternaria alternata]
MHPPSRPASSAIAGGGLLFDLTTWAGLPAWLPCPYSLCACRRWCGLRPMHSPCPLAYRLSISHNTRDITNALEHRNAPIAAYLHSYHRARDYSSRPPRLP